MDTRTTNAAVTARERRAHPRRRGPQAADVDVSVLAPRAHETPSGQRRSSDVQHHAAGGRREQPGADEGLARRGTTSGTATKAYRALPAGWLARSGLGADRPGRSAQGQSGL